MEIKCIIVDDEPPAQRVLENYIKEIPSLKLEGKCKNALEAMDVLMHKKIDIMFLDINMPKINGLDFLKTLKNPPAVIITTAYREYAVDGFELDVSDYLKKPFSLDRFIKAVNKVTEKLNMFHGISSPDNRTERVDSVFIKENKITYQIQIKDIIYIEGVGDYVKIITDSKTFLTKQTLKKTEQSLPTDRFIRVHKSFIVSISKITKIDGNTIYIGKTGIPLGYGFQKTFWGMVDKNR